MKASSPGSLREKLRLELVKMIAQVPQPDNPSQGVISWSLLGELLRWEPVLLTVKILGLF